MALLREAFATVKQRHPFRIDAMVILPDYLHCLWTLPPDDADYSTRWMLIKSHFTRRCAASLKTTRRPPTETNWPMRPIMRRGTFPRRVRADALTCRTVCLLIAAVNGAQSLA